MALGSGFGVSSIENERKWLSKYLPELNWDGALIERENLFLAALGEYEKTYGSVKYREIGLEGVRINAQQAKTAAIIDSFAEFLYWRKKYAYKESELFSEVFTDPKGLDCNMACLLFADYLISAHGYSKGRIKFVSIPPADMPSHVPHAALIVDGLYFNLVLRNKSEIQHGFLTVGEARAGFPHMSIEPIENYEGNNDGVAVMFSQMVGENFTRISESDKKRKPGQGDETEFRALVAAQQHAIEDYSAFLLQWLPIKIYVAPGMAIPSKGHFSHSDLAAMDAMPQSPMRCDAIGVFNTACLQMSIIMGDLQAAKIHGYVAVIAFSKAIKISPHYFFSFSNRATAYHYLGMEEDAEKDIETFIYYEKSTPSGNSR